MVCTCHGFLFFLLFALKLLATSLCIGFGLFGGVFSPAAMIGAAAGGFIGKFMAALGFATVRTLCYRLLVLRR